MSLIWAERAIDYVRTTVGMLSDNRAADRAIAVRDVDAARREGIRRNAAAPAGWQHTIAAEASAYRDARAGNCLEMAKVAFVYLARQGVTPIEVAWITPRAAINVLVTGTRDRMDVDPDHAFVIIGRKSTAEERRHRFDNEIEVPSVDTWNFGAVICDPWSKRCYLAHRLAIESQMINRVTAGDTTLSSDPRLEEGAAWTGG
jgi:hypothetical protein